MNMSARARIFVLGLSVVILLYVGLGSLLGRTTSEGAYQQLTVFSEVLNHIDADYVETPDIHRVTVGALRGMLEALDPYSSYLTPREYADFQKKKASPPSGNVGLVLSKRAGWVSVITTLPDSPAARADLRTGDILESLAGFSTREMSVEQAYLLLSGEPGTSVRVDVVRQARTEPQSIDLVRAQLPALHVVTGKVENDIGYVKIAALTPGKADEVRTALRRFASQGIHKLVLDLRDTASGSFDEGVAVSRLLLPNGTITYLQGQQYPRQQYNAEAQDVVWTGPVAVLINTGTAGPAEVIAAAVADNHRGQVVGQRTYGVGALQKFIPLENGAALVLSVAKYYTPAGKELAENGVTPTTAVELKDEALQASLGPHAHAMPPPGDPVMLKALELLRAEPVAKPAATAG